MSDLLEVAVGAHGGLDRWKAITSIDVAASVTGATWLVNGKGDALKNIRFEVDTTRELLTMDFVSQDKHSIFEPSQVVIQRRDGAVIVSRDDPERSFDGHAFDTPWDDIHVAYFSGEALWTYVNTPLHPAQILHQRNHPDPGRRRNVAAAEGDISRSHQKSCPRTGLVLWTRRATAPATLHRRYPGRRTRMNCAPTITRQTGSSSPQAADPRLGG